MDSWRDSILSAFATKASKLTLVADPDSLLAEEKLAEELRRRGFDLIEFNDPVDFRYAYELNYRSIWDKGEHTDLVVILRLQDSELEALPYDLLQVGRKLFFSLGSIFPNLSYPVVSKLGRGLLDALFDAQKKASPGRMGDNATKDFILLHVFRISVGLISTPVDLLRVLFRLHYGNTDMPAMLAGRLAQLLNGQKAFRLWPLAEVIPDAEAFFSFLQERWPIFLGRLNSAEGVQEDTLAYSLKYPGPAALPFDHPDIRVFIPNLFAEGRLTPVLQRDLPNDVQAWIRSGVKAAGVEDENERINSLFDLLGENLPTGESRHSDWTAFALKWAELAALIHGNPDAEGKGRFFKLRDALNETFAGWLSSHYASLISLPPTNPVMVHQVPRRLAREMEEGATGRVALVVVDGLALDQWVAVRKILLWQDQRLVMRESAVFAWIPTVTSVSRQSIFSGKAPFYFPNSINTTNNEGKLWRQFWEGADLSALDVGYLRGLGDGEVAAVLERTFHPGKTKVLGLVVDKVDKIMHGMELGAAGMHNQVKQWCKEGFLGSLIAYLLDHEFQVWLTSDHGNIECIGRGRPSEGAIAESRGERVRIYPTPELRATVARSFAFAHEWQPVGLPPKYFPLVAGGNDAFITLGAATVSHGGISMEEAIVPLVKIERKIR
ncbi:MAG: BREX-3 system phosphatase PglZ [Phaeodactylibacter sp.]|nr:BREX-3 system phosphatase PglZ [Phaeodactylibacter sp.]